jgi:membrane-bound lytic murein transglycosylase D
MILRRSRLATALALALLAASSALAAPDPGEPSPAPTPPAAAPPVATAPSSVAGTAVDAPAAGEPSAPTTASTATGANSPGSPATAATAATATAMEPAATPAVPVEPVATLPGATPAPSLRRGDEVFARIRTGLSRDPCAAGEASTRWQKRYAINPRALAIQLERILPLLDFVSVEVARTGLPAEFVFIPLVESWYKPEAIGVGGPAGMWQMIGTTAKNHGIHIRPGYDGRLSPVESTRAALSYLKVLYAMFDGWEATVMAYNAGEGRLLKAFKRARSREASGNRRRPHGLSNITYDYVAKLQALSCLVTQPERHRLSLPLATRFVPLAPVQMEPGVASLEQFARRAGQDPAALRRLNPGFRNGFVVAGVPRLVLMPLAQDEAVILRATGTADGAALATAGVAAAAAPAAPDPKPVEVPSAASAETARAAGATLAMLSSAAPASAGSEQPAAGVAPTAPAIIADAVPVAVARIADRSAAAPIAAAPNAPAPVASASIAPAPIAAATTHQVSAGDSLWSISRAYRISVEDLRTMNSLGKSSVLRPGQTLKVQP